MFGKRKKQHPDYTNTMQSVMKEAQKDDPLNKAQMGAQAVKANLYDVLQKHDPRGVHVDTVLCILGSMAGFSCLVSAYFARQAGYGKYDPNAITVITCADGNNYVFGNLINAPLLENQYSVWGLVGGIAQHLGSSHIPDIANIAKHVASTAGSDSFGIPRMPEGHNLSDSPRNYVKNLWPVLIKEAKIYAANSAEWPVLFGLAAQQVIQEATGVLDSGLAAEIVMECAVPMSKIDPNEAL